LAWSPGVYVVVCRVFGLDSWSRIFKLLASRPGVVYNFLAWSPRVMFLYERSEGIEGMFAVGCLCCLHRST